MAIKEETDGMKANKRNEYLFITSWENYEISVSKNLCGVKDKKEFGNDKYKKIWDAISKDDLLLFYVKYPMKKAVATCRVKSKYVDAGKDFNDGFLYSLRMEINERKAIEIPYEQIISGRLKMADGRKIIGPQQLRSEIIPLQNGSIANLFNNLFVSD